MKKLALFALVILIVCPELKSQSFKVIPVPYKVHDLSIPHPAYNGHPTVLKAIARGSDPATNYFYRWDADGNGTWDNLGSAPAIANGNWYYNNGFCLDGSFQLPTVDPALTSRKVFVAKIEVAVSVDVNGVPVNSQFGSYPVLVFADVPVQGNANTANNDQLSIMRDVTLDDALWYLHKNLTRSGSGNQVKGYLTQPSASANIPASAIFLQALENNGHIAAYPAGTYNPFSTTIPVQFTESNNYRWNSDPYSEDAARLLNYLLGLIQKIAEGYYYPVNELNERSFAMTAIAYSSLGPTVAQTGPAAGETIFYIVQKMVDFLGYAQIKTGNDIGGWGYSPGQTMSVSYITGGSMMALMTAEYAMYGNITIPAAIKYGVARILYLSQNSDGGVGWSRTMSSSLEPTGLYLAGTGWLGWNQYNSTDNTVIYNPYFSLTKGQAATAYNKYTRFIADKWNAPNPSIAGVTELYGPWQDNNYNSGSQTHSYNYTILNTKLGATSVVPGLMYFVSTTGLQIDWNRQFAVDAIRGQFQDGHFSSASNHWLLNYFNNAGFTAMQSLILSPAFFDPDPVAVCNAQPLEVLEGCAGINEGKVTFSHENSYHPSPSKSIVEYQWLFEVTNPANPGFDAVNWNSIPANGFSTDGRAWHTNTKNSTVTYRYLRSGLYNAALRVVDNGNPAKTNIIVIRNIKVNASLHVAPIVYAGGPYKINPGENLVLNGSAADPNSQCNPAAILTYSWDLNNDGSSDYNSPSGTITWTNLSLLSLPLNIPLEIRLKVTNNFAQITEVTTQLIICSISPELGPDCDILLNEQILLDAGPGYTSYLWNDGTTGQTLALQGNLPGIGSHKYWVKVSNQYGCTGSDTVLVRVTTATGIFNESNDMITKIYPNPAGEKLSAELKDGVNEMIRYKIYSTNGILKISNSLRPSQKKFEIDVASLEEGIYLLQITSAGRQFTCRFVKE